MTLIERNKLRRKQDKILKYAMQAYGREFGTYRLCVNDPSSPTMTQLQISIWPTWEPAMDDVINELGI